MPCSRSGSHSPPKRSIPPRLGIDKLSGRRHRRADARTRTARCSRPCSARRSGSRSASRSSRRRSGRADASSSSAPARAAGSACSSRPRCRRPSARTPTLVQAIMAGGKRRHPAGQGRRRGQLRGGRAVGRPAAARPRKDVVVGVSASGMTPFVRGALTRARQAGAKIIFVTCDPAHRAADLRRPDDRAGRRPRGHRRLDAPQGRHRDEDGAQHADDGRDGPDRQDLRQPDGRRADRLREAAGTAPAASSTS